MPVLGKECERYGFVHWVPKKVKNIRLLNGSTNPSICSFTKQKHHNYWSTEIDFWSIGKAFRKLSPLMNNRRFIWIVKLSRKGIYLKIWALFPAFQKNKEKDFTEKIQSGRHSLKSPSKFRIVLLNHMQKECMKCLNKDSWAPPPGQLNLNIWELALGICIVNKLCSCFMCRPKFENR